MTAKATSHHARVTWDAGRAKPDVREHLLKLGEQTVAASCQPALGGDPSKADPEKLFVASLSACHMLWFLDFARRERVRVVSYEDDAEGAMDGERFTHVSLRPVIRFAADPGATLIDELHSRAHQACFIARSVSCPVEVEWRRAEAEAA